MIVLDASAAIDLVRAAANADTIAHDLAREAPVLVPAHFEADAYAGLRRMVNARALGRESVATALDTIAALPSDRVPLAPLLSAAYALFDRVGAHDSFYVALALGRDAALLTSDGPLARAAEQCGVKVLLRPSEVHGDGAIG